MLDLAIPTHATIPTARIAHPNMSYLRSLLFCFLDSWNDPNNDIKVYNKQTKAGVHQL